MTSAAVTVARNAGLLIGSTVFARATIFVLGVAIARGLGAEDYGRYGVALALATVLVAVADLGATPYISREASRERERADRVVGRLFAAKLMAGAALALVVTIIAWLALADGRLVAAIAIVLAANLLEGLARLVYAYFQGRERMGFEAATSVLSALARAAGGVALVVAGADLVLVLLWLVLVSLVQVAVTGVRLRRAMRPSRKATARPGVDWRAAGAMGVMTVFVMIYLRADTVLVAWLVDQRAAGWYTAAYTVMASLQILPWMVALALTPVFARTWARDERLFQASWHEGTKAVLVVALPLALVMSLLAGPIIDRIFGGAFEPSSDALAVLAWACPLAGLNVVAAAALRAAGRERALMLVSAAGAVFNIGMNLWAIPAIGIEGAAAVTVATEAAVVLGMGAIAGARGIVELPGIPYGRMALALGALAGVALALDDLPVEVAALGALLAYAGVLALTGVVGEADVARLRAAAGRSS